jgi:hypothetical protein
MFDRLTRISAVLLLVSICAFPALSHAEDAIEYAGEGVGLSAGNVLFLPIKAISVGAGLVSGALSFVMTGNADLTKQIWRDTTEGPYLITPEVARMAVGQRPELAEKK